jgi:hypothetical protein
MTKSFTPVAFDTATAAMIYIRHTDCISTEVNNWSKYRGEEMSIASARYSGIRYASDPILELQIFVYSPLTQVWWLVAIRLQ